MKIPVYISISVIYQRSNIHLSSVNVLLLKFIVILVVINLVDYRDDPVPMNSHIKNAILNAMLHQRNIS